jgi:3-hydroxybutyryl-CoA dehydrogenase
MVIERVGVVGCGLMGSGIAEVCARAGLDVVVREASPEAAEAGLARINTSLERAARAGKLDDAAREATLARIRVTTDYGELADRDMVIEAVVESEELKAEVFGGLSPDRQPCLSHCAALISHFEHEIETKT